MRDRVLLFCLLGLLLTAAAILIIAPGHVTWALSLIEQRPRKIGRPAAGPAGSSLHPRLAA
jgi:hypothetical protein